MNFKACCGLLASKDDEDHDYEDVEQEPLPKPQRAADLRKKVRARPSAKFTHEEIGNIGSLPLVGRLLLLVDPRGPYLPKIESLVRVISAVETLRVAPSSLPGVLRLPQSGRS